eukprot:11239285-Heterocapsa_arctica.AAC.1
MENAEPSPGPIMSARSAEEVDSREPDAIVRHGDSDWVEDKITRKSVSKDALLIGGRVLADYARSQATPAGRVVQPGEAGKRGTTPQARHG